jgi:lipopolysaccharide/colanic/teichoic acid biosynthesis glycosyltransferase
MSSTRSAESSNGIACNAYPFQRAFDLGAAAAVLLLLSPLLVAVAVLVKLTSPGPVFHKAERVGKGGQIFRLYKFRSMVADASRIGPAVTSAGDTRITGTGKWLRRFKIDELPQLFNVVKGEMSLVGPRPEDPKYVARFTPEQQRLLSVAPGITGAASVRYRSEEQFLTGPDWENTYVGVILPDKLRIELEYLQQRTFISDMCLLLRTALVLFK